MVPGAYVYKIMLHIAHFYCSCNEVFNVDRFDKRQSSIFESGDWKISQIYIVRAKNPFLRAFYTRTHTEWRVRREVARRSIRPRHHVLRATRFNELYTIS